MLGGRGEGSGPRSSSRLPNELLKDNPPHKRVENESELEKRKAEWNEICWGGDHNLRVGGGGAESLSPQPPGEGQRRWRRWAPPSGELLEQIV